MSASRAAIPYPSLCLLLQQFVIISHADRFNWIALFIGLFYMIKTDLLYFISSGFTLHELEILLIRKNFRILCKNRT